MIEVLITGAIFFILSVIYIYLGIRLTGLISWAVLVPLYFLVMMLLLPIVNYLNGSYQFYGFVPDENDVCKLYIFCSLGILFFFIGYIFFIAFNKINFIDIRISNFVNTSNKIFISNSNTTIFIILTVICTAWSIYYGYFGLTHRDSSNVGNIAGLVEIISSFIFYINIIVWWNYFSDNRRTIFFPLVIFLIFILFSLFKNSKGALIFPFLQVAITYCMVKKKIPIWFIICVLVLYYFIAYPFIQGFRYANYFNLTDKTAIGIIPSLYEYFFSFSWLDSSSVPEGERALSLGRGLFSYLAYIFKEAGTSVEFLFGTTYYDGLEFLVPRFLFENKVDMATGNWVGHLFNQISMDDNVTNLSPSFMGEFYMNNGIIGVIIGMFVLGVFSRLIDLYIYNSNGSWLKVLFIFNILWLESFIGMAIAPFIKSFIIFIIFIYIFNIINNLFTINSKYEKT